MSALLVALGPLGVYHAVVLAFNLALLGLLLVNMAVLPNLRRFPPRPAAAAPFVSICVPARDEADQIEGCLHGLLALDYPAFEVLVLDDGSTDGTAAILARLAAADARLQVLPGRPLPSGWLGKAHACAQLAAAARGEVLLFTDADVRHAPALLGHAVAALLALDAGLLSIFPTQITATWAERLLVPLMQHFAVYVLLPLPLMTGLRAPAFAAANGQFLLFQRRAYRACGGHTAVRTRVLEDVSLARAVKAAGYRALLADGNNLVTCRMYTSAGAVWAGFAKNLFAFFNRSRLFLAAGLLVAALLWVLPPLWALAALPGLLAPAHAARPGLPAALFWLPLAAYGTAVGTRLLLAHRFHGRAADAFGHPLGVALLLALGVHSARLAARNAARWKGRPTQV